MKRIRIGKIARLSLDIRNKLNEMIQDGKPGTSILKWVNSIIIEENEWTDIQVAITKQNLSDWRKGGYQDWLAHQQAKEWVQQLAEKAEELDATAGGGIADRFGAYLAVEMTRVAAVLLERETDPEKRWARLCEVSEKLSRLRRDDQRGEQARALRREREEAKKQAAAAEDAQDLAERKKERKLEVYGPMEMKNLAELHGGGVAGWTFAARVTELKYDLPEGDLEFVVEHVKKSKGVQASPRDEGDEDGGEDGELTVDDGGASGPVQASPA